MLQFFTTNIAKNAKNSVAKVLDSGCLSEGKVVKEFEKNLQNYFNWSRKPVAVNSGTSGLHLALAVAGIEEGDEVILPPQTFIATGLAVLMQKAKPIFADIQPNTGNISPESIRKKITRKTKAIFPVHWCGYPCDMDEIHAIAREFGLVVIEDAAHALGATYKNKIIGSLSDFTVFSFQAIKHLTTGDGGAVCALTERHEKDLLKRRWFNIDREEALLSILGEREYNSECLGFKYHMNDFSASLGLANLDNLSEVLKKHRRIGNFYQENLQGAAGIELLSSSPDRESAYWTFTFLVERREDFIRALASRGVPASIVHGRIDKNQVFGGITPGLAGQDFFEERQIALPIHTHLTDRDVQHIVESVKLGW